MAAFEQQGTAGDWPEPIEIVNEGGSSDIVLICEHASNHIPAEYAGLGLGAAELTRHIAWDIGAGEVTRALARRLDAPAFLGTYSRLLIDLNRPLGAGTSIPIRSEATDIPGNAGLDVQERARRARLIFAPFHQRVAAHLDARARAGRATRLLAMHSFTPVFHGEARPWHAGVLYDEAPQFGKALRAGLAREPALNIGVNVPYVIHPDEDYAMLVHGYKRGLPAALLEIRQDLVATPEGVAEWAGRLATLLPEIPAMTADVAALNGTGR